MKIIENSFHAALSAAKACFACCPILLLSFLGGCRGASNATFTLAIQPQADAPAQVEVIVTASDARVWSRLASTTGASDHERLLSFHIVNTATASPSPPLLGTYTVTGQQLRFQPSHPLLAGQKYQARFCRQELSAAFPPVPLIRDYTVPTAAPAVPPRLTVIYPTAGVLPANHLKFYLVFSEPMRPGEFLNHLKLLDSDGREVLEPFRETELWSADGCRLTLWFHPGRQKTGVNLNVEIGPVLEANRLYQLVVSRTWPSQRGTPLGVDVIKLFTTSPTVHGQLDVQSWQSAAPRAGTRDPLRVIFPKPLDWALLQNQLRVEAVARERVAGQFTIAPGETAWSFIPAKPWSAGEHRLAIGTVLEDLAGNSVAKPFEVDLQAAPPAKIGPVVYREFTAK